MSTKTLYAAAQQELVGESRPERVQRRENGEKIFRRPTDLLNNCEPWRREPRAPSEGCATGDASGNKTTGIPHFSERTVYMSKEYSHPTRLHQETELCLYDLHQIKNTVILGIIVEYWCKHTDNMYMWCTWVVISIYGKTLFEHFSHVDMCSSRPGLMKRSWGLLSETPHLDYLLCRRLFSCSGCWWQTRSLLLSSLQSHLHTIRRCFPGWYRPHVHLLCDTWAACVQHFDEWRLCVPVGAVQRGEKKTANSSERSA